MKKFLWLLLNLVALQCSLLKAAVQEKAEAAMPATTLSPPEGNTTFLGGTTWCVARPGVSQADLQVALDWACGPGRADCGPIRAGGPCFEPNTLVSHASFAFNNYYQQNGNSDIACYFGGTAVLTQTNPGQSCNRLCKMCVRHVRIPKSVVCHADEIHWKKHLVEV